MPGIKCLFVMVLAVVASTVCAVAQPRPERAVEPLLGTMRVQTAPYNASCPYYDYGDSVSSHRCLVGCVATAIEQLLSFYRYPDVLFDSIPGWETGNYSISTVPAGTKVDWDDVADLSLWCGMIVKMKYSPDASAASLSRAEEPLRRVFGYKTARILDRGMYTYDDWHRILQAELIAGRPVAYVGYSNVMRAHAFNIDGMDENGLYHCNWGEGEGHDGYFDIDHLCQLQPYYDATDWGRMVGYHANEYMLVLHPDSVTDAFVTDTLEDFAHTVRVEDVNFRRTITNREYTLTDVALTNLSSDTLYQTYEIVLNNLSDTAMMEQGRAVSLSAVKLLPGETRTQAVAVHYPATQGRWLVSVTFDGEEIAFTKSVDVAQAVSDKLFVPEEAEVSFPASGTVRIAMKICNGAESGVSGRLLYYKLYRAGADVSCSMDYRFLNLPAGNVMQDTLFFHNLMPETAYSLQIGGWSTTMYSVDFTVPSVETGMNEVSGTEGTASEGDGQIWYDMCGRALRQPRKGIYIKDGKKIILP
ncbi:MAG: C10 family peptidase [Bacteroides sp.]|nr:C10 family peptidase [Bacteroides sp.]MCM1447315.1 C10 family peptidase [Bacteroides sp.]MCM1516850.1 C10 family peptidase [Paraprevotella sp.]